MFIRNLSAAFIAVFFLQAVSPALAVPTLEDFLRDPDVRDVKLSPDGKHLAMILNEGDKRTVFVRNIETPDMPVVGAMADDVVRPNFLSWGNNDRLIVSMLLPWDLQKFRKAKREGTLNIKEHILLGRQVAVDKDMKNLEILLDDDRNLGVYWNLSSLQDFLPDEPDHVMLAAWRNDVRVLFKVNIVNGTSELIAKGSKYTRGFFGDGRETPMYRLDYRERARVIEIFKQAGDDNWTLVDKVYPPEETVEQIIAEAAVSMSGLSLVIPQLNPASGHYDLVESDIVTGEHRTLVALDDQDVDGAVYGPRTDQLIGYRVEVDLKRNVYFDKKTQQKYDEIADAVGNYNFSVDGLDRDSGKALVSVWGADDPLSYFLWDYDSKTLGYVVSRHHRLPPDQLSLPAQMTYKTRDGLFVRAYILLPQNFKKGRSYPTILMPHGGPVARSRPEFDALAQFLSTRGFIVVEPNFRGSTGYGQDFEAAGYKQWGGLMQDDLTDAVNFMVEQGYSDPERVCIVGGSYGGYAALMGAIKTPELYQCAVSINGVTHIAKQAKHFMQKLEEEAEYYDPIIFNRIGHPERDRGLLDANSPALHADKIKIPVLIIAGDADEQVPYDQSRMMVKALEQAGADYTFVTVEDAGHNIFDLREDRLVVFDTVNRFLDRHLR